MNPLLIKSTKRRRWISRVSGWGKSKRNVGTPGDLMNNNHDNDIPLHVSLGKVSRSILEDDITLESGDIFTNTAASYDEEDEQSTFPPPPPPPLPPTTCRLRPIDETCAEWMSDDQTIEKQAMEQVSVEICLSENKEEEIDNDDNDDEEEDHTTNERPKESETSNSAVVDHEMVTVPKYSLVDFTSAPLTPWICW